MMDILYVVGTGSKWNDNELRFSLRSIEKNCKNVGRIFISGYCPGFIDRKKVTFVSVPNNEDFKGKHKNIMNCIEQVVEHYDISDNFLYSSDDHFYVQPTDFDNYPFYRKGHYLPTEYDNSAYSKTLVSTRTVLEAAGLTTYNFSWHGNTHFNKTLFMEPQFAAMRKITYNMLLGCEPSILMLNYWLARRPFEITDREDIKFPSDVSTSALNDMVKQRECISCASSMSEAMKTWLAINFPNKSKYEK